MGSYYEQYYNVQGSGIGPSAYLVYSADLKSLSDHNRLTVYLNMLMILLYLSLSAVQFIWQKNFNMCNGGPTPTSYKSIFPKLKNLYLDVHLHIISLYHNPFRLLNNLQLQNCSESIFLPRYPLLHMLNRSWLLISECSYLHSSTVKACRVMLYTLYLSLIHIWRCRRRG